MKKALRKTKDNMAYFESKRKEYEAHNLKLKSEAEDMEKLLIRKLKTQNRKYGYNIANGGNSNGKHSDETRKKIKENHFNISGENHPMYGRHHSKETKQKISEANKGHKMSEETRQKMSKARKGKPVSEETKIELSSKEYYEDIMNKISEKLKGKI